MLYQCKQLPSTNLGSPAPLPADLVGLNDASLADLSAGMDPDACEALGYVGQGFFPVQPDPPEPEPRRLTRVLFIQRIPIAKRADIVTSDDPLVKAFLFTLQATDIVELDNEDTTQGVAYLVSQALLTQDEATALLA